MAKAVCSPYGTEIEFFKLGEDELKGFRYQ